METEPDPLTLLRLQIDWGADEALADTPVDRLAAPPPARPIRRAAAPAPVADTPQAAQTLEEWRALVGNFTGCRLRDTATTTVLAEGDVAGRLLVIGEPPGADDDRSGRPFSGPAGAVLDRILSALGLAREKILLVPLIPWRPPGNRPPTDAELAQCLPLLHQLIALARPRHIVLTGILPTRALLGSTTSLRRARGRWTELQLPGQALAVPALPVTGLTSLKTAAERRDAWLDWRMLHRTIMSQN
jgi:uracil-DNA glycosylase family 4